MAIVRDDAIVLRSLRYRETSKLIVALTPAFGKVHLLAKGAREFKRGFGGSLEILTRSQVVFYHKKSRDLHLLHSAATEQAYLRFLRGTTAYHLGCAALEFVLRVVPEEDPSPELFLALAGFLERGESATTARELFWDLRVFQFRTVALLGYAPHLESCAQCGRPAVGAVRFGVPEGGVLCPRCRAQGETLPLAPAALKALRRIVGPAETAASPPRAAGTEIPRVAAEEIPRSTGEEIPRAAADRQVADVVESFLRFHVTGYQGLKSLKALADWRLMQRAGRDGGAAKQQS